MQSIQHSVPELSTPSSKDRSKRKSNREDTDEFEFGMTVGHLAVEIQEACGEEPLDMMRGEHLEREPDAVRRRSYKEEGATTSQGQIRRCRGRVQEPRRAVHRLGGGPGSQEATV